jgi:hypothetical protein
MPLRLASRCSPTKKFAGSVNCGAISGLKGAAVSAQYRLGNNVIFDTGAGFAQRRCRGSRRAHRLVVKMIMIEW